MLTVLKWLHLVYAENTVGLLTKEIEPGEWVYRIDKAVFTLKTQSNEIELQKKNSLCTFSTSNLLTAECSNILCNGGHARSYL